MPDDPTNEQPDGGASQDAGGQQPERGGVTDSGYSYTVVDDDAKATAPPPPEKSPREAIAVKPWVLGAAVIIPAIVVGAAVWLLASQFGDENGDGRLEPNVTNVVNAFSQSGEGTGMIRLEGSLPEAFPDEIPVYPGSRVISSIVQLRGDDAGYIVVFDTDDARQDVAAHFADVLSEDPWQVEVEQSGRESTVVQFSNIEDPDIEGVVLAAESKDDAVTTIFMSVNVVGAAADNEQEDFEPGQSRPLPAGFPAEQVPPYPDSTTIETGFQRAPQGQQFIVSMVTEDAPNDVLDYYREQFDGLGWTVEEGEEGTSTLANGTAINFTNEDGSMAGTVEAGELAEDGDLTRVNVQVATPAN
ncbi:MAG: hypothetical protein WEB52_02715 [Dehalococcoidia bacterium]